MVSFVDTFPPTYTEAREAADLAKRLAKVQEQQQRAQMASVSAKLHSPSSQDYSTKPASHQPHSLGQALLQRPALSRTGSNSVLGGIFQSLATTRSSSPFGAKESVSGTSTPAQTPLLTPTKMVTQAELEAAMAAEKKRDADIVSGHDLIDSYHDSC